SIPKLREIAVRDAAMADIIIISSHGDELPDHVTKWMESWLMEGTSALALVALFEKAEEDVVGSAAARTYLAGVAKRGQLEFFAQPDQWPGRMEGDEILPFHGLAANERTLSTLAGAVHRDTVPRWGINE